MSDDHFKIWCLKQTGTQSVFFIYYGLFHETKKNLVSFGVFGTVPEWTVTKNPCFETNPELKIYML